MLFYKPPPFLIATVAIPLWGAIWEVSTPTNSGLGVAWGLLFGAAVVSAYTDIRWRRIYNAVTYTTIVYLIALNAVAAMGWGGERLGAVGLGYAFAGAVVCLLIAAIPYLTNTGGAGDAKLGAVIGAVLGVEQGIITILVSFVVAGVLAVAYLIWKRGPLFVAKAIYHGIGNIFVPLWIAPVSEEQKTLLREPFPMAPSYLIGTIIMSLPQVRAFFE